MKREKCANVRTLVYKMQVRLNRLIVAYTYEAETLVFKVLFQRVISLNGLSFVSARPAAGTSRNKPRCHVICLYGVASVFA